MPITQDRLAGLIRAGEAWAGSLRSLSQGLEAGTAAVAAGVMTADDLLAVLSANLTAEQAKLVDAAGILAREREWLRSNAKRNDQERARKQRQRQKHDQDSGRDEAEGEGEAEGPEQVDVGKELGILGLVRFDPFVTKI